MVSVFTCETPVQVLVIYHSQSVPGSLQTVRTLLQQMQYSTVLVVSTGVVRRIYMSVKCLQWSVYVVPT